MIRQGSKEPCLLVGQHQKRSTENAIENDVSLISIIVLPEKASKRREGLYFGEVLHII